MGSRRARGRDTGPEPSADSLKQDRKQFLAGQPKGGWLSNLPTLGDRPRGGWKAVTYDALGDRAKAAKSAPNVSQPKPEPRVLAKQAKKRSREALAKAFRDAVWKRDKGRCRATGVKLARQGTNLDQVGEVDHALLRSTDPDKVYEVSNGILLQGTLNRLRKAVCPQAPEHKLFDYSGPADRGKPQRFVWRDRTGKITKERVG